MIDAITDHLTRRTDLIGWTVRHIVRRGSQLYAAPGAIEALRDIADERYVIDVLADTTAANDEPSVGAGNITLLPGDDISTAIDAAALHAGLVRNRPYSLPAPAVLPDVPILDEALCEDMPGALAAAHRRLQDAVDEQMGVRMTAAELSAEEETVWLRNSRGVDAMQTGTSLAAEWVLLAREGDREVETFVEMQRRRLTDMPLAAEVARRAEWARDLLVAQAPPDHSGAVVLRGAALAEFMGSGVIQLLASAAAKYSKASTWKIGASIFRDEVTGDPLTVWANRQMPYGVASDRFDAEGIPSQRLLLIDHNRLMAFSAEQRYAAYLDIPATGQFGVIEVAPGQAPEADLVSSSHVEIAAFSWFNPDEVTGDFACEIRLGYWVSGAVRVPFKGGQLIGNYLDALAAARWSRETGFEGTYLGPTAVRFERLTVAA